MRLSDEYRKAIKETLRKHFGDGSKFYLFGSRVDDTKRGGDIDLYIETDLDLDKSRNAKIKTSVELMQKLGEQKIDIVVYIVGNELLPIHKIARMTGIEL